jgi:hypothetical protein
MGDGRTVSARDQMGRGDRMDAQRVVAVLAHAAHTFASSWLRLLFGQACVAPAGVLCCSLSLWGGLKWPLRSL